MTSPSATNTSESPAIAHFDVRGVRFSVDVTDMPHPPTENPYFRRSQLGHLYEPTMTFCLAQILSREAGHCFLDVGSRMGYYASLAAAFIGDGRRVHAVEADPAYAVRTARSCAVTGYPEASVYDVILSDVAETAAVDGRRGVVYDEPSTGATTTITGDDLCARHGFAPTVVKVDVHGCEGKVLKGMQTVLRDHVQHLLLELHDTFRLNQYSPGITRAEILQSLDDLGFSIFHVAGEVVPYPFIGDEGFTYRPLKDFASRDIFFDRSGVLFLLVTRAPDIESVLGPSVDDPRWF